MFGCWVLPLASTWYAYVNGDLVLPIVAVCILYVLGCWVLPLASTWYAYVNGDLVTPAVTPCASTWNAYVNGDLVLPILGTPYEYVLGSWVFPVALAMKG